MNEPLSDLVSQPQSAPVAEDQPSSGEEGYTPAIASIFSKPEDIRRYVSAKANGASEMEALAVGDNGEGKWGDDTTSTTVPMVALPEGTPGIQHGREVKLRGPDGTEVVAKLADVMSNKVRANIDLNPAAAAALGHPGGLMRGVGWKWNDGGQQPDTDQSQTAALSGTRIRNQLSGIPMRALMAGDITGAALQNASPEDLSALVTTSGGSLEDYQDLQDGIYGTQNAAATETPQPPANAGQYLGRGPHGEDVYSSGLKVFPDHSVQYKVGDKVFYRSNPYAKPVDITPKTQATQLKMPDGSTHKVLYNTQTGAKVADLGTVKTELNPVLLNTMMQKGILPYDEDGNELSAKDAVSKVIQHNKDLGILEPALAKEVTQIAQQEKNSRNLYAKQYVTMYGNYESAMNNIAIPLGQRTGVDDVFLLSAASGIENPGRSNTGDDMRQYMSTKSIRGKLDVAFKRYSAVISGGDDTDPKGGRILSDAQVRQTADALYNAIQPRYHEYLIGAEPSRRRLEQRGVNPEDYIPSLPLKKPEEFGIPPTPGRGQATTTASPAQTMVTSHQQALESAQRILSDKNADPMMKAKAQAVIEKVKQAGLIGQ